VEVPAARSQLELLALQRHRGLPVEFALDTFAQAFGGIAERAERIGQLNVSPDLLQGLLAQAAREETGKAGRERGK